ncbi:hypothetical protein Tco_0001518 [Tanacetum coccineum]
MANKNTHVANVANHDQTNRQVGFVVRKHTNGDVNDVNEEEYYRLKLEDLANEHMSLFSCEEDVKMYHLNMKENTNLQLIYEQNEMPGGSIYWEPHVEGIPIPVEGTWYDTVDEAIDMYSKYVEMGGFEVKKSGQRMADEYVQGKTDDLESSEGFEFFHSESDAQMLIKQNGKQKNYVPERSPSVRLENSELVRCLADDVDQMHYKEFWRHSIF